MTYSLRMPKKKRSALKRIRQTRRRTTIKTLAKSSARTAVKAARDATADITDAVRRAASALDKASKRGAIHKNAARRSKSRLMKRAAKKA